jgi:polysaccharide deacetylase 2 family uncharacterized protein YibQ
MLPAGKWNEFAAAATKILAAKNCVPLKISTAFAPSRNHLRNKRACRRQTDKVIVIIKDWQSLII